MTEILGLDQSLEIVMGGRGMNGIVFPLVILFLVVTLAVDSSVFSVEKTEYICRSLLRETGLTRHMPWQWEPAQSLELWHLLIC